MAFSTFFVSWLGALARFYTVLVEASDDAIYVLNAISSVICTSLFMVQFVIYRNAASPTTAGPEDDGEKNLITAKDGLNNSSILDID